MVKSSMLESDFSLYLTHSVEDEDWQMVCTDAGSYKGLPGSSYPPHLEQHPAGFRTVAEGRRLNEYQMVYLLDGQGTLEVDGKHFSVRGGSLFLLFPEVPHAYRPDPTTGWTECWVGFKGPHVDALLASGILNPSRPLFHPGYQASLVAGFQSIFQQVKEQAPLYQFRACAEVLRLLAETLSLERLSAQQTKAQEIVEKAKAFIEASIPTVFNLEKLGSEVHLSQVQLNEVFKAYTGMTPYQYCLHAKINRAKEILSTGESSVKEIAWRVGFDDPYYFSRLFKKKTGSRPSEWTSSGTTATQN